MDRLFNYSNFYPLLHAAYQQNGNPEIHYPQFPFQAPATSSNNLMNAPSSIVNAIHPPHMVSSGSPPSEPSTSYTPDTSFNQPSSPSGPITKHSLMKRQRRARAPEGENLACTICGEPASGCVFIFTVSIKIKSIKVLS